jgi:hypothetical protein
MSCPICTRPMKFVFTASVLKKYTGKYDVCNACGFLRVREPNWLEEAYSSAIVAADTGLVERNILLARKVAGFLYWVNGDRGDGLYLDAAGGYGLFTRLMRDIGFNFYWADKYCTNVIAPGFEYSPDQGTCKAVTAIEVLEHLVDPVAFIHDTMSTSGAQTLLFTTELYKGAPPHPVDWWYYTFETGQHIGFFQRRTLETLGRRLGLNFSSANGLHLFSTTPVNKNLLKFATGWWSSRLSPWWIRRRLGSKAMGDHLLMMNKT